MESKTRGNPSIWRVAEWLWDNVYPPWEKSGLDFNGCAPSFQNQTYDKAAELMEKLQLNEFTGEDTHKD